MLTEPQIQRYARQLLLRDVGERGQEELGAVLVELVLPDEVAATAAVYLRAGGTEVHGPAMSDAPWARTPPLLEAPPQRRLHVVAAPTVPGQAAVVVGSDAGRAVLWSAGETGCRPCLADGVRGLGPPELGAAVQIGSLVALLVQRRALGLASPLEGLELSGEGAISTLAARPCSHRPPAVPDAVLRALLAHLASALPDEGCAVLVGRDDEVRLVPMQNAQATHHARDPEAFPRTARTAFSLDPRAWLGLLREVDRTGERVLAIAHSHPDGGTHFSGEDRRWAAPDGLPLLPGAAHLVVAFSGGRPRAARWALWSDGDFLEMDCPLPSGS